MLLQIINGQGETCDVRLGSSCYVLVTEALTWADARDRCLAMGGHLAVIESAEENDLIHQVTLSKFLVFLPKMDRHAWMFSLVIILKRIDNT